MFQSSSGVDVSRDWHIQQQVALKQSLKGTSFMRLQWFWSAKTAVLSLITTGSEYRAFRETGLRRNYNTLFFPPLGFCGLTATKSPQSNSTSDESQWNTNEEAVAGISVLMRTKTYPHTSNLKRFICCCLPASTSQKNCEVKTVEFQRGSSRALATNDGPLSHTSEHLNWAQFAQSNLGSGAERSLKINKEWSDR